MRLLMAVGTMGLGDDARSCFTTRTRECGDEQDGFCPSIPSIRTEKVPPPRIIKQYAPIATANRQARQARRRRSPCRRSAMLCPWRCFWRPALTEQGAKTIAYKHAIKQRKAKRKESKARNNKTQRKQRNSKGNKQASKKADRAIILKYQARKSKHKKTIKTSKAI